ASFVILGDLNADPDEGRAIGNAIANLLSANRNNGSFVPIATQSGIDAYPELDPDDTAEWGLRVDYVLPSSDLEVLAGGVWRRIGNGVSASDHFPVFLDIVVPAAGARPPGSAAPQTSVDEN
ncbi:MAG: endonuclease/exonuclease/phosphatase family protein, partial [Rhodothermales bacterium]|nr:endonuclease/exonuclease/phosphatase family protein [Rhodothermales bacterium]